MRARAKTINFATIYGQGPHALSRQLKIAHAEAKEFIERYFQRFHRVREYLDSMVEFAREHGYVQTIFNRRRYIPELRDRNFNIRAFGERTAANSPIQGSAADLIKIAMIRIHNALAARAAQRQDVAPGPRRAGIRGPRAGARGRESTRDVRDGARGHAVGAPRGGHCRREQLARDKSRLALFATKRPSHLATYAANRRQTKVFTSIHWLLSKPQPMLLLSVRN